MITSIITNYNNATFIEEAIKSVFKQSHRPSKIIVVDDASTDNSVETIKNFLANYETPIPIELVIHERNLGAAAARNTGITKVDTEYVSLLDGDDYYYKNKLKQSIDILDRYPAIGMVYSDFDKMLENSNHIEREYKPAYDLRLLMRTCIANTNSVFRTEVFRKCGMFNQNIRGGEDYDMWLRIAKNYLLYHIPEALFMYRLHGNNVTIKNKDDVIRNTNMILGAIHGTS